MGSRSNWLKTKPEKIDIAFKTYHSRQVVSGNFLQDYDLDGQKQLKRDDDGKYLIASSNETLLPSIPASPYRFVPALLTTAGVLGTFWGITIGLSSFEPASSSQALMQSATTLLNGMKTAFFTSLIGMLTALTFMLVLALNVWLKQRSKDRASNLLAKYCREVNGLMLLQSIIPANQNELAKLQVEAAKSNIESNTEILTILTRLNEKQDTYSTNNLAVIIGEAVGQAVEKELAPSVKEITQELKVLREIKEKHAEEVVTILLEQMKQSFLDPIETSVKTLAITVQNNTESFEATMREQGERHDQLILSINSLTDFQTNSLTTLQEFALSLKETLSEFNSQTSEVLKHVSAEIKTAMASSIEGMKAQREAFEESARIASEAFVDQNRTLGQIGEESTKLMTDARESLLNGLADLDNKVQSMSEVVQTELERFRNEYQANLVAFFESQSNLLEDVLSKQKDGLSETVEQFRDVFMEEHKLRQNHLTEITEQHQKLTEGVITVERLVEAVGMTESSIYSQLEEAAGVVSNQVGKLRREYELATKSFNMITERMPEEMNKYFNTANETHQSFFENFDDAAAKVHGKLAEAANMLVTAMQQIELQNVSANNLKDEVSERKLA